MTTSRSAVLLSLVAAASLLTACSGGASPEKVADEFLQAFNAGDSAGACRFFDPEAFSGELSECQHVIDQYHAYWEQEDSWTVSEASSDEEYAYVTFDLEPSGGGLDIELELVEGRWVIANF